MYDWGKVREEAVKRLDLHIGETYVLTVDGSRGRRKLRNMTFVHANNYGLIFHRTSGPRFSEFTFDGTELIAAEKV